MYGTIRHEIRIHRSAADVWALAGDAGQAAPLVPRHRRLHRRRQHRASSPRARGMPMPEEILVCDDTQRRFQYRLTTPMFNHHRGTIDVIDLADDDVHRRVLHRGRPAHDGARHRRRHCRCASPN